MYPLRIPSTIEMLSVHNFCFNCLTDVKPTDFNSIYAKSIHSFGAGPEDLGENGMIGLTPGNFIGKSNGAPFKPWLNFSL